MNAIETVALSKSYRRVQAVRDLNLTIPSGAFYTLMGPNGAGKTTLIKLLMNLLHPTSGHANVLGNLAAGLNADQLQNIGYVSENQKLPDWMTAGAFLRYLRPFYATWDSELEKQLILRFNLPRKQKLKQLSRGVRMKVALTTVLAYRPKILILDEPLSGLDPLVRDDLVASILEKSEDTTVLLSSHDLAEIDAFATHVGYMGGGRLHFSEPIGTLRSRFRKIEINAGLPLAPPPTLPAEWLHFSHANSTARWVESDYNEASSIARAQQIFGDVSLTAHPMTLREIFLTMARSSRVDDPKAA